MTRARSFPWLLLLGLFGSALAPSCDGGEPGQGANGSGDGSGGSVSGVGGSSFNSGKSGGSKGSSGGSAGLTGGANGMGGPGSGSGSTTGQGSGSGGTGSGSGGEGPVNGGTGPGGELVLPTDECQTAADCVACEWDTAPRNPGECYCPFCNTVVMSTARCETNQAEFKKQRCDKKVCPKESQACSAKQVACVPDPNRQGKNRCVDPNDVSIGSGGAPNGTGGAGAGGTTGVGGAGTGGSGTGGVGSGGTSGAPDTFCNATEDCVLCDTPTIPATANDCYCPQSVCPVALNAATCQANQAAYYGVCSLFVETGCLDVTPAVCSGLNAATCLAATNTCAPACTFPTAPASEAECYCDNRTCPVPVSGATCQANQAAWNAICPNWVQQNYYVCAPYNDPLPFCGENGPITPTSTQCRQNYSDCTSCEYPAAPSSLGECYCPSAACPQALNSVTCNANTAAWNAVCGAWSTNACSQVIPPNCPLQDGTRCNLQNQCELLIFGPAAGGSPGL